MANWLQKCSLVDYDEAIASGTRPNTMRRHSLLLGTLLVVAYLPVAQAQALPAQLLLNAASWAFQKMMEESGKPVDPYAVGTSFDGRIDYAQPYGSAGVSGGQFMPVNPSYVPSTSNVGSFDAGNAYQTSR
jgi:hypothetical protein